MKVFVIRNRDTGDYWRKTCWGSSKQARIFRRMCDAKTIIRSRKLGKTADIIRGQVILEES